MRKILEIILHSTATASYLDLDAADIRAMHIQRGFSDIGYHFVVRRNGEIETGRPVDQIGAHCKAGGHNHGSIGVVWVGGADAHGNAEFNMTRAQLNALDELLPSLCSFYHAQLFGHRDFAATACPSCDVHALWPDL